MNYKLSPEYLVSELADPPPAASVWKTAKTGDVTALVCVSTGTSARGDGGDAPGAAVDAEEGDEGTAQAAGGEETPVGRGCLGLGGGIVGRFGTF